MRAPICPRPPRSARSCPPARPPRPAWPGRWSCRHHPCPPGRPARPRARGRRGQRGRDGGLADTTLARDDDHPGGGAEVSQLHRPEPMGARRRPLLRLGAVLTVLGLFVTLFAVDAAGGATRSTRTIDVIQIDGLIDPPNANLIVDAVHAANRDRSQLLVITLDSGGAVNVDPGRVLLAVRGSRVPVV